MNKNLQKGFTLVELSIVLVIIGLLIGGILAAQSMIGTAKVQALTRQIGSFDTTVANFQTKFGGLPGDTNAVNNLGNTAGMADGNGFITSKTSSTAATAYSGEIGLFWHDLSISGLSTDGTGAGNTPANTYTSSDGANPPTGAGGVMVIGSATANAPKAKAGGNTAGLMAAVGTYNTVGPSNWYHIMGTAQGGGAAGAFVASAIGVDALKSADALALDTKIDDGVGNTGNIQSVVFSAGGLAAGGVLASGCAGGVYVLTVSTVDCDVAVRMGISTGTMQ